MYREDDFTNLNWMSFNALNICKKTFFYRVSSLHYKHFRVLLISRPTGLLNLKNSSVYINISNLVTFSKLPYLQCHTHLRTMHFSLYLFTRNSNSGLKIQGYHYCEIITQLICLDKTIQ